MKVIKNKKEVSIKCFKDLTVGDVFEFEDRTFIKISENETKVNVFYFERSRCSLFEPLTDVFPAPNAEIHLNN